jgi:DNA segregation ATPase FtsK/SpoIIIE-like protein
LVQLVDDNFCKKELHRIMSKCRKYGIYFILGGQDATKEIIGRCKMNCPQVIGFKTFDATDSDTLIGRGQNLQDITIQGRCKVRNKKGIREVQVMYIDEDEIEELLKDNLRE